jgi:hypothetical protein
MQNRVAEFRLVYLGLTIVAAATVAVNAEPSLFASTDDEK